MDDFVPNFKTASNLIKQCGGLVFLTHILTGIINNWINSINLF